MVKKGNINLLLFGRTSVMEDNEQKMDDLEGILQDSLNMRAICAAVEVIDLNRYRQISGAENVSLYFKKHGAVKAFVFILHLN